MAEPEDYTTRLAREEREREHALAIKRRAAEREQDRWMRDKLFEASKHMTTLSASVLVLIFAAQRLGIADVDALLGMFLFGMALLEALTGMGAALYPARVSVDVARIQLGISTAHFIGGVYFVVVWPSIEGQMRGGLGG